MIGIGRLSTIAAEVVTGTNRRGATAAAAEIGTGRRGVTAVAVEVAKSDMVGTLATAGAMQAAAQTCDILLATKRPSPFRPLRLLFLCTVWRHPPPPYSGTCLLVQARRIRHSA